jgi:hypothetical protein
MVLLFYAVKYGSLEDFRSGRLSRPSEHNICEKKAYARLSGDSPAGCTGGSVFSCPCCTHSHLRGSLPCYYLWINFNGSNCCSTGAEKYETIRRLLVKAWSLCLFGSLLLISGDSVPLIKSWRCKEGKHAGHRRAGLLGWPMYWTTVCIGPAWALLLSYACTVLSN